MIALIFNYVIKSIFYVFKIPFLAKITFLCKKNEEIENFKVRKRV
jgi:hypothetical protein